MGGALELRTAPHGGWQRVNSFRSAFWGPRRLTAPRPRPSAPAPPALTHTRSRLVHVPLIRIPARLRGRARRRNQQSSPAASPSSSEPAAAAPRRAFVTLVVCCYALSDSRSYGAPSASCRAPQAERAPLPPHLSLTHRHRLAPSQELAAAARVASLSAACARFRSRGDTHATWYGFIPARSRRHVRHPRTDCEDELVRAGPLPVLLTPVIDAAMIYIHFPE
ncbi:hypothetical protein B0H10DRAFT_2439430, partial [Mycena sp. CBHHK59/15]